MKDTDFVESSAYLRVQEKRLLQNSSLERVVDAPNVMEALRMLSQNTDYDFASLKSVADYEQTLKAELKRVYKMAYALAKGNRQVVDILACRYDFHNVKAAVKANHFRQRSDVPYVRVTDVDPAEIERLAQDPTAKTDLPEHIAKAVKDAQSAFGRTSNPQDIDVVLDKAIFAHMLTLCETCGNSFITDYVKMAIDFYNIKTLLRVKAMQKGTAFLAETLAPGGKTDTGFFVEHYNKTPAAMVPVFYYKYFGEAMRAGMESFEKSGNYSNLERLFDNLLIAHTKAAKYMAFGAEVLFSYLVSKENEIRQIRIVITCKQNNIPQESLRERLRDNYA
ncbi:V-type ATP synthase subunit C [Ruminococcaceae bacterium OttesenSCG-928-L11]|nr:V-type ATP synthase subunit C [Ruminococcaceae bacterium OttesenSCG-928-L11]